MSYSDDISVVYNDYGYTVNFLASDTLRIGMPIGMDAYRGVSDVECDVYLAKHRLAVCQKDATSTSCLRSLSGVRRIHDIGIDLNRIHNRVGIVRLDIPRHAK